MSSSPILSMRIRLPLLCGLLLLPLAASAETFGTQRAITLPPFSGTQTVRLTLDDDALEVPQTAFRIVNAKGVATPFWRQDVNMDILPGAQMDSTPAAADTVPHTTVSQMLDSQDDTAFQPVTAQTYVFRFHFDHPVAAQQLMIRTGGASIGHLRVRQGASYSALADAYVGEPSGEYVTLSGERAQYFEVTVGVNQGVLKITTMGLFVPKTDLFFRARGGAGAAYRLLYRSDGPVDGPETPSQELLKWSGLDATLGPVRTLTAAEQDDADGIAPQGDNCPLVWNAGQEDSDHDGVGDRCDNCVSLSNPDQADRDGNGAGDVCDDQDHDGLVQAVDNCPAVSNPEQGDQDADGIGDFCDTHDDRFSEQQPWLLWASFAAIVVALTAAGAAVLRRVPVDHD
jgi:hypothetical protein